MGKKRRARKKPASSSNTSTSLIPNTTTIVADQQRKNGTTTPLPAVLQRLRHADAAIVEATIHGLSSSASASSIMSSNRTRGITNNETSMLDFRILQELRNQVSNHSISAATCLIPHLSHERTSSWWSTFHQVVTEQVRSMQQEQVSKKNIDNNTTVTNAATGGGVGTGTQNSTSTHKQQQQHEKKALLLLECLKCCTTMVENNPFVRNVEDSYEIFWEVLWLSSSLSSSTGTKYTSTIRECSTYAARILHAMSENKSDIWQERPTTNVDGGVTTTMRRISTMMDGTVRGLHLLGTAINCSNVPEHDDIGISYHAIPLALQSYDGMAPNTLQNLCDLYEAYASAQHDASLESQVVRSQHEKHEPARQIARRLHKNKKQQKKNRAKTEESSEMVVDDEHDNAPKRSGKLVDADFVDDVAAWWNAVAEWEERLEPVELALEILANITLSNNTMTMEVQQTIPNIMSSLDHLLVQLHNVSKILLPAVIQDSITAVQNTAAVCTGNLLRLSTTTPNHERLWYSLQQLSPKTAPILSAQTLVLKTHGFLYRLADSQPLALQPYIQLVELCTEEGIVREAITLVSLVLTREPHDAIVNRTMAHALVHCPISTGSVITEQLNAVMDIYGEDDCHVDIFEELNLLEFVKSQRKLLKERIHIGSLNNAVDKDDIAMWQDAVENATEFVQYKQDLKHCAMQCT